MQEINSLPKVFSVGPPNNLPYMETRTDDTLRLTIMELPEMISVETRFLTQQAAAKSQIENLHRLDADALTIKYEGESINVISIGQSTSPTALVRAVPPVTPPVTIATTETISLQTPVLTSDASTMTESENPKRDRAQQTENNKNTTVSVGIQCNVEEEMARALVTTGSSPTPSVVEKTICDEGEKEKFLQFVESKMLVYSNDKRECLICGEITANIKAFYKHMSLHWGPKVLCYRCGLQFEHNTLLQKHRCEINSQKTKVKQKQSLKCPHFRCAVQAISPLELYDHINEHTMERLYNCFGCKRTFCTAGELRHHLPLRLKCLEVAKKSHLSYKLFNSKCRDGAYRVRVFVIYSARKKRVLVKSFLSQRILAKRFYTTRRCHICMSRCTNKFKYDQHIKRCLQGFARRLQRKSLGQILDKSANGRRSRKCNLS